MPKPQLLLLSGGGRRRGVGGAVEGWFAENLVEDPVLQVSVFT